MPQAKPVKQRPFKVITPTGNEIVVVANEDSPDSQLIQMAIEKEAAGTSISEGPQTPSEIAGGLTQYLPSGRTVARTLGAAIGGGVGASAGPAGILAGGIAGGGGGEAAYQLAERALGGPAPQTSMEATTKVAEGMLQGGVQETIGPLVTRGGTAALKALQRRGVEGVLKPSGDALKEDVAALAAGDFAEKMPLAATQKQLVGRFQSQLKTASAELDKAIDAVPVNIKLKLQPVADALKAERAKLFVNGVEVPGTGPQRAAYDEVIGYLESLKSVSLKEARQNRQIWDDILNYSRSSQAREPAVEGVYKSAADKLRGAINSAFPSVKKLNNEVAELSTAVQSSSKAETRTVGQRLLSPTNAMMGTILGTQLGAQPAIAGILIKELVQTPAWKTASIQARQLAIQALQRGEVGAAINALTGQAAGMATRRN